MKGAQEGQISLKYFIEKLCADDLEFRGDNNGSISYTKTTHRVTATIISS